MMKRGALLFLLLGACSSSEPTSVPTAPLTETASDAATDSVDAGGDAPADATGLSGTCASTFGSALTAGFGRIDGRIYALQMPNDQSCTMPNRDHLIVQVLMGGAVYRMVVNTEVRLAAVAHPLPAPTFAEGWHAGLALDYPSTLDAHSPAFAAAADMNALVAKVIVDLHVGDRISVYATSGEGRPESAHLVHRNTTATNADGAIVVRPDAASPTFLLFAFADQTF